MTNTKKTPASIKWIIGIVVILGLISALTNTEDKPTQKVDIKPSNKPTMEVPQKKDAKIEITSMVVKKVEGKYRYFFNIKNIGEATFTGDVRINLINAEKTLISGQDFRAKDAPIEVGVNKSVYLNASTGPVSVHGQNGIKQYQFNVFKGFDKLDSQTKDITDKLENL